MPRSLSGVQLEVATAHGWSADQLAADLVRRYVHLDQPLSTIAADYGITKATASRWLREAGVVVRRRGRRSAQMEPVRLETT